MDAELEEATSTWLADNCLGWEHLVPRAQEMWIEAIAERACYYLELGQTALVRLDKEHSATYNDTWFVYQPPTVYRDDQSFAPCFSNGERIIAEKGTTALTRPHLALTTEEALTSEGVGCPTVLWKLAAPLGEPAQMITWFNPGAETRLALKNHGTYRNAAYAEKYWK